MSQSPRPDRGRTAAPVDRRRVVLRAPLRGVAVLALAGGLAAPAQAQIFTRVRNGVVEATNVPASREFRLTYPGKGTLIHSRGFRGLLPSDNAIYNQHIEAACAAYRVSVALVRAVIQTESQFDALAVSSKGARGLMQLMPDTARRFGVGDSFDPRQNIFGGVQYLRFLLDLFQGDVSLAAAAYNSGENAVLKYNGVPPYRETQDYVARVQALLGGVSASVSMPSAQALFLAPAGAPGTVISTTRGGGSLSVSMAPVPRPLPVSTLARRPRTYFKWTDASGVLHVSQAPPADGVVYTTVRAVD